MANFLIIGLGNKGEEYDNTRHNIGKEVLLHFAKAHEDSDWKEDKKLKAKVAKIKIDKNSATLIIPEMFMNQSGLAIRSLSKAGGGVFKPEQVILIHDDMDLPLGSFKISFNRGSGGHRGVESVSKVIKSTEFTRVRIGVSPVTAKGLVKKPKGEDAVVTFILGKFKPVEVESLHKVSKWVGEALEMIISDAKQGREKAMGMYNTGVKK